MANPYNDRETERARYGRSTEDYRQANRGQQERGYEGQSREYHDYDERGYRGEGELRAQFGSGDYQGQWRQGEGRYEEGRYGQGNNYGNYGGGERSGSRRESEQGATGYGREWGQGGSRSFSGDQDYYRRSRENQTDFGGGHGYGGDRSNEQNWREENSGYGNESGARENNSWSVRGPYTGHGPQGYKRSDERIMEDVNERLTQHGHIDASMIQVKVKDGEVTLTGTVSDRQTKRMAEDLAEDCSGVKEVQNQLRVKQENQSSGTRQNQATTGQQSQPEMRRSATK